MSVASKRDFYWFSSMSTFGLVNNHILNGMCAYYRHALVAAYHSRVSTDALHGETFLFLVSSSVAMELFLSIVFIVWTLNCFVVGVILLCLLCMVATLNRFPKST